MITYVELITVIAEVCLTWFFFSNYFHYDTLKKYQILIFLVIYGVVLAAGTFFLPLSLRLVCVTAVIFLGNFILFHNRILNLVYWILLFFTSSIIADILCSILLSFLGINSSMITNSNTGRLIYNSSAKLTHLILLLVIINFVELYHENNFLSRTFPLILCHFASILVFDVNYQYLSLGGDIRKITIATVSLLYINIVLCFYIENLRKNQEEHQKRLLAEQQLKMNQNFYNDMLLRQEETRSLWHDIKKYTLAIETLVNENDLDSARSQARQMEAAYEKIRYTVDSGNPIVDNILNHEMVLAIQHDIKLELNLWVAPAFSIDATDLYVILGNTIDNAIEACAELPQEINRIIHITLSQKEHILYYEIRNPYQPGKPSKIHKKIHGYGLANVSKCVERNRGTIEITENNHVFTVSIILNV